MRFNREREPTDAESTALRRVHGQLTLEGRIRHVCNTTRLFNAGLLAINSLLQHSLADVNERMSRPHVCGVAIFPFGRDKLGFLSDGQVVYFECRNAW